VGIQLASFWIPAENQAGRRGYFVPRQHSGRTDLPGGDGRQILRSIHEKLLGASGDGRGDPGHGPNTTIGREKERNPFLQLLSARDHRRLAGFDTPPRDGLTNGWMDRASRYSVSADRLHRLVRSLIAQREVVLRVGIAGEIRSATGSVQGAHAVAALVVEIRQSKVGQRVLRIGFQSLQVITLRVLEVCARWTGWFPGSPRSGRSRSVPQPSW